MCQPALSVDLLATPLPTYQIVWAKWRGAYRGVPWLAVLPGLNALVLAATVAEGPVYQWLVVPLVIGFVLACGAALTSLTLNRDRPAMTLDELRGQEQPEPDPA